MRPPFGDFFILIKTQRTNIKNQRGGFDLFFYFWYIEKMTKDNLIQITNDLYRLTLLFPKKEPLRYKMREVADDILADLTKLKLPPEDRPLETLPDDGPLGTLEVLDSFFEVAKVQNWVSPEEILKLQENYSKLKEELKTEISSEKTLTLPLQEEKEHKDEFIMLPAEKNSSMPERQERILAFLKEQGRAQVWQLKQVLPEVTKRTLRRDFENLLKKGLIERLGERNNTFYQVKIAQA